MGSFNVAKYAASVVAQQLPIHGERGLIILVSSVLAEDGPLGQVAYSASKGAINGMALPLARDLGKHQIRAMVVAPGLFETPMSAELPNEAAEHLMPLSRKRRPDEFAMTVEALIVNPYATGEVWRVTGGLLTPYL